MRFIYLDETGQVDDFGHLKKLQISVRQDRTPIRLQPTLNYFINNIGRNVYDENYVYDP